MRFVKAGDRTARLEFRLRADERADIERVAQIEDALSASDWVRRIVLAETRRILAVVDKQNRPASKTTRGP
jgi:hypothetical protein